MKQIRWVSLGKNGADGVYHVLLPTGAEVKKPLGRVVQSTIQMPGQQGPMAQLEIGILVLADWNSDRDRATRRFLMMGLDKDIPEPHQYVEEFMLPNGMPIYLFELVGLLH